MMYAMLNPFLWIQIYMFKPKQGSAWSVWPNGSGVGPDRDQGVWGSIPASLVMCTFGKL